MHYMNTIHKALAAHLLLALSGVATAQCANPVQPSCGVYDTCFAKYCPCQGDPAEYFLSYGKKYCTAFLSNISFSAAGNEWRDAALVCLQEKIVPHLDISSTPICNCSEMRKIAFDAHVACYTQPDASICDLPAADLNEIRKIIDTQDLLSSEGWKQMRDVAAICATKAPDDGRRTTWKAVESVLKLR